MVLSPLTPGRQIQIKTAMPEPQAPTELRLSEPPVPVQEPDTPADQLNRSGFLPVYTAPAASEPETLDPKGLLNLKTLHQALQAADKTLDQLQSRALSEEIYRDTVSQVTQLRENMQQPAAEAIAEPISTPSLASQSIPSEPVQQTQQAQPWDELSAELLRKSPQWGPNASIVARHLYTLEHEKDPAKQLAALASLVAQLGKMPLSADIMQLLQTKLRALMDKIPTDMRQGKALKNMLQKLFFDPDPAKSVARIRQLQVLINGDFDGPVKEMRALFELVHEFGPDIREILPEKERRKIDALQLRCGAALPDFVRKFLPLMENSDIAKAMLKILSGAEGISRSNKGTLGVLEQIPGIASGGVDLIIAVGRLVGANENETFNLLMNFLKIDTLTADYWKALMTALHKGDLQAAIGPLQSLADVYKVKFETLGKVAGVVFEQATLDKLGVKDAQEATALLKKCGTSNAQELLNAMEQLGAKSPQEVLEIMQKLGTTSLSDTLEALRSLGVALNPLSLKDKAAQLFKEGLRPQTHSALVQLTQLESRLPGLFGSELKLSQALETMKLLKASSLEQAGQWYQQLGRPVTAELAELMAKTGLADGQALLDLLRQIQASPRDLLDFMAKTQAHSADEVLDLLNKLGKSDLKSASILLNFLIPNADLSTSIKHTLDFLKILGIETTDLPMVTKKLKVKNLAELEKLLIELAASGYEGLSLKSLLAKEPQAYTRSFNERSLKQALQKAQQLVDTLGVGSLKEALALVQKLKVTKLDELLNCAKLLGLTPVQLAEQWDKLGARGLSLADVYQALQDSGIRSGEEAVQFLQKAGEPDLCKAVAQIKAFGYAKAADWIQDAAKMQVGSLAEARKLASRLGVSIPELAAYCHFFREPAAKLEGKLKEQGLSGLKQAAETLRQLGVQNLDELHAVLEKSGLDSLGEARALFKQLGIQDIKELNQALSTTGAKSPQELLELLKVTGTKTLDSFLKQQSYNLKLIEALDTPLSEADKLILLRVLASSDKEVAEGIIEGLGKTYAQNPKGLSACLQVLAELSPSQLKVVLSKKSLAQEAISAIQSLLKAFEPLGIPLKYVAPKIAWGLGKAVPGLGAYFALRDVDRLLDIATTGRSGNKSYPDADVRKLAYIAAKLNGADFMLALLEILGVGNIALPVNLSLAGSEILLDVLIEYFNAHPEALTPEIRVAINAFLVASGPDGLAYLALFD